MIVENYKEMQALYEKLKGKGFVVLAFPCNQFGAQEPDACPVIQKNMQGKFGVTFPIFDKVDVNGANTSDVFKTLKGALPGDIGWNFEKFLVDKEGNPVKRFKSGWSSSVEEEVTKLL
jgi:glutathione peroxidase